MNTLNDFEKPVLTTVDTTLKEQKYTDINKLYLENGSKPVAITQEILNNKDYPKTY